MSGNSSDRSLNWDKPLFTRSGQSARLVVKDRKGVLPYLVLVTSKDGRVEEPVGYDICGRNGRDSIDLLNEPPQLVLLMYRPMKDSTIHTKQFFSRHDAESFVKTHFISQYEILELTIHI